jgi:hypothetical protein
MLSDHGHTAPEKPKRLHTTEYREQDRRLAQEKETWRQRWQDERRQQYAQWLTDLIALEPDQDRWRSELEQLEPQRSVTPAQYIDLRAQRMAASLLRAHKLLEREDLWIDLMPLLRTTPHDPLAVARAITPVMVNDALTGRLDLPLLPILFAAIAFSLLQTGVIAFITSYDAEYSHSL